MDSAGGFGYIQRNSPVHKLTGASKLLLVLLVSIAAMVTYDTRYLLFIIAASFGMLFLSKVKLREVWVVISLILFFILMNNLFIFLFSPEEGVKIYGTRHEIAHLFGRYYLTKEQLFYQFNVTIKYFSILPVALIFFVTTDPSEFASSLNKVGVSYKIGYSVSLALRYIPDVKRNFREISQAQQARGIDTSRKVKLPARIKNSSAILFPLVFSSLAKVETISNAMELRSFGKLKKRTWYSERKFSFWDYFVVVCSILVLLLAFLMNYINGGRFYNPFS